MDAFYNKMVRELEYLESCKFDYGTKLHIALSELDVITSCWLAWQVGKIPYMLKDGTIYFPKNYFDQVLANGKSLKDFKE